MDAHFPLAPQTLWLLCLIFATSPAAAWGQLRATTELPPFAQGPNETSGQAARVVEDFDGVLPTLTVAASEALAAIREHTRTDDSPYRGRRCEALTLMAHRGGERILATQAIFPVAVISELQVSAWVRGNRHGYQIMMRVRLPRSLDEAGLPLALYVGGDHYAGAGNWQQLRVADFESQLKQQARAMRAHRQHDVDLGEAYVDQIAFNLFGEAGVNRIWIDDLAITAGISAAALASPASPAAHASPASHGSPLQQASYQVAATPAATSTLARANAPLDTASWRPQVMIFRGQDMSDVVRQGFDTVCFLDDPDPQQLQSARDAGLDVICPPLSSDVAPAVWADVRGWLRTAPSVQAPLDRSLGADRPWVSMHEDVPGAIAVDADVSACGQASRWIAITPQSAGRWQPIRDQIRAAVFHGYDGYVFDPEAVSASDFSYREALGELSCYELSLLRPWADQFDILKKRSWVARNGAGHVDALFSRHAALLWIHPTNREPDGPERARRSREIRIPDAAHREAYYLQPGGLEPLPTKRVPGGMQISLNRDMPYGLVLLTNQPQILRTHQEYLKSLGPRWNELLTRVIRQELVALDQSLAQQITDEAFLAHLRKELHSLHGRIAPILTNHPSLVTHRQLNHLLFQLERVQSWKAVR